jgi:integrase/recombinase XerD
MNDLNHGATALAEVSSVAGLATDLLRHGASLTEIGQVLRHSQPDTTQIYAKVDITALRAIALPWPGVCS